MIKNLSVRHALQSNEWMDFQTKLGKKTINGFGDGWSVNAVLEDGHSKLFGRMKRLYAPYGPHAESLSALREALKFLELAAKENGASYVRVEPTQYFTPKEMSSLGCKKSHKDYQPGLTNVVDLTKDSESLIASMDYEMRRLSRQLDKRGFTFEISYEVKDIEDLLSMMNTTSERTSAVFREADYLRTELDTLGPSKNVAVAYAINGGKRVSGVLFYDDFVNKTRYYFHAGSTDESRKLGGNPAAVLHLIFNAKESGQERFDLFGVSPSGATDHRWAGFSKFKRDFGGEDLQYSGTWELPVDKLKYTVMSLSRSILSR